MNMSKLKQNNIKRILKVNGIESMLNYSAYNIEVKVLPIEDTPDFNIDIFIDEAHQFMNEAIRNKQGVLVVCTAGISRSATVVISYLIRYKQMNYEQSFDLVKKARFYIQPNQGFQEYLKLYEKRYACELCQLEKRTERFEEYSNDQFLILLCEQCELPMVVYGKAHQLALKNDEYATLAILIERFGNDYFGRLNWYIDTEQRTISDHFHWHIRPKDKLKYILDQARNKEKHYSEIKLTVKANQVEKFSMNLVEQHLKNFDYQITETSIQNIVQEQNDLESQEVEIISRLKLCTQNGQVAIHQIAFNRGNVIKRIFYRIKVNTSQFNHKL